MLDPRELAELEESLKKELDSRWTEILSLLNRSGQLEHFLDLIGLSDLLYPNTGYKPYPTGKIVVIGGSQAKENVLLAIGQSLGINKGRFEMYLDYDAAKHSISKKCSTCPSQSDPCGTHAAQRYGKGRFWQHNLIHRTTKWLPTPCTARFRWTEDHEKQLSLHTGRIASQW